MWLERIAGGGVDLVDLADAKAHLRVLDDESDTEISNAIDAASTFLDIDADGFGGLGFPLISQTWSIKASSFGAGSIRLPFGRVTAVTSLKYYDADNVLQTIDSADYHLAGWGRDFLVVLATGKSWPSVYDRPDAAIIEFVAGYADTAAVPSDIKAAARLLVGHFFENREAATEGVVTREIELGVSRLTRRYQRLSA